MSKTGKEERLLARLQMCPCSILLRVEPVFHCAAIFGVAEVYSSNLKAKADLLKPVIFNLAMENNYSLIYSLLGLTMLTIFAF